MKLTADAYEKILEIFVGKYKQMNKKKTPKTAIMNLWDLMVYRELQHFVLVNPAVEQCWRELSKNACLVIIVFRLHLIWEN